MAIRISNMGLENTRVMVCLKLHGCRETTAGVNIHTADAWSNYMTFGYKTGSAISPYLMYHAATDDEMNQQAREQARLLLRTTANLPRERAEMTAQGIVALFLWLVVHNGREGEILFEQIHRFLRLHTFAVITIGCTERKKYAVIVDSAIADMSAALREDRARKRA